MENVLKIRPFLLLARGDVQLHKSSTWTTPHFLKVGYLGWC